jgi:aminoglycoside phosphotransferase (APT) family kinase protein
MAAGDSPGRLIGVGRSADIYDIGNNRVLRRYRSGQRDDTRPEADLMIYLAQAGFPVPAVHDATGPDIVMERLEGRDMLGDLGRRPWLAGKYGRILADLHNRLHQIDAPPGLRPAFEPGDKVVHLDLHPANVMLTARGPMVIDWSNAAAGVPAADVAIAYVIIAASETDLLPAPIRAVVAPLRAAHLRQFLAAARDDPTPVLASAARYRMNDRNIRTSEVKKLRQIAERADRSGSPANQ